MIGIKYSALMMVLALSVQIAIAGSDYNQYGSLELSVKQETSAIIEAEGSGNPQIDLFDINLTFFPKSSNSQIVLEQIPHSEPDSEISQKASGIRFTWKNPTDKKLKCYVDSKVKTISKFPIVENYIRFPSDFEKEIMSYTLPTETIDINENIRKKASEIIQGQTDYYKVVFMLADWVQQNVDYSLTTMTEEASLSASWVLENRKGVCDEITTLYIALLRSAGIPARFVGGQAYSNIDGKFGNHGWAEVYFPKAGWIPVDVTYGQIGWIDPTHVKFSEELDPKEPSVNYYWKSLNAKMNFNPVLIRTEVARAMGEAEKYVEIKVEPLVDKAGPESHVPIKVTVKNLRNHYSPALIHITKAPNLTGRNSKPILLTPNEERAIFWTAIMPPAEEIKEGYVYTTTIEADSSAGHASEAIIKIADDYEYFDEEWASDIIQRLSPREDKAYLPNANIECSLDKEHYYRNEEAILNCTASNTGNTNLEFVKICYLAGCLDTELLINEKRDARWSIPVASLKDPMLMASVETKNTIRPAYLKMKIIEIPEVIIKDYEPKSMSYYGLENLSITLNSNFTAYNLTIEIRGYGTSRMSKIYGTETVVLPIDGKTFRRGSIDMGIRYQDEIGAEYSSVESLGIEITEKPWLARFLLWIEKLLA